MQRNKTVLRWVRGDGVAGLWEIARQMVANQARNNGMHGYKIGGGELKAAHADEIKSVFTQYYRMDHD